MTVPRDKHGDMIVTADNLQTVGDVLEVVAWITRNIDYEEAHVAEDALYCGVLERIKEGCDDPEQMAAAALEANTPDRVRWYA